MVKWLNETGLEKDVVVSTRIRIARNLERYRFPHGMSLDESAKLTDEVLNAMKNFSGSRDYKFIKMNNLSPLDKMAFVEEHVISPGLIQKPDYSSFLLRDDENITIMINEEDHLRVQSLLPGLNFKEGWKLCNDMDDFLEENLDFAFHQDFGYLTCCPTNAGTGLRASVMVHIPSIVMTGYVNSLIQGLNKIGLTVRGIYGEGSKAIGNLYQISNQTTLGEKEEIIIEKLNNILYQIINKERIARNTLLEGRRKEMEDRIFRSLGLLKYSRIMNSKEAMVHLSNVRLGKEMGIIKDVEYDDITNLMIEIQPASIQKSIDEELSKEERDIRRADLLRKWI
ncbi:MAG: protein arginine kinase [Tissierellia bacterium]|nr:protein arginine kinase [Tissierellia bacterium]